MDSSMSPTHGEQEMSVWNGHYACTCYHPLFVFNQLGDLERCALRPGNVHSADGCDGVLKAVIARYQGKLSRIYFRADAAFAMPEVYEFWKPSASNMRSACRPTGSSRTGSAICSSVRSDDLRTICAPVSCELQLLGRKLEQAAPGDCQGRVASRRTFSARRLHRDEHEPPGRARGRVLQQAGHVRAMDQGRQMRDQMDAAVVQDVRGQRRAAPTSCARLQSRHFLADAGDARADQGWA